MFPALSAVTFPGSWLTLCPLPRDPCSQSSLGCLSQPRGTCHVHPWWDIAVPDLAFSFYTSKNPTQRLGNATRCCLPGGCLPGCSAQPWGHPSPGTPQPRAGASSLFLSPSLSVFRLPRPQLHTCIKCPKWLFPVTDLPGRLWAPLKNVTGVGKMQPCTGDGIPA